MKRAVDWRSSVNLKLLNTFLLVGENQSFRVAADRAHRSGSAVSSQVKKLEEQLGVALFHRTTRQVRLTAEGEQLLVCVRRALHDIEEGLQHIQESANIQRGRISLACAPTVAGTRLGGVLAAFEHHYPGIHVSVREITAAALFESVRQREVDFGISVVIDSPEFRFQKILSDELHALVPRSRLARDRKTITLKALSAMPLLLLEQGTALRKIVEDAMAVQGLTVQTHYQFIQAQTLISMASAGLGAAVLPNIVIPAMLDPSVQKLRIVDPPLVRELAVVTLPGQSLSPAASRLIELLRQMMGTPAGGTATS
jgi:DNA-binding transcriptional LysR family regulator